MKKINTIQALSKLMGASKEIVRSLEERPIKWDDPEELKAKKFYFAGQLILNAFQGIHHNEGWIGSDQIPGMVLNAFMATDLYFQTGKELDLIPEVPGKSLTEEDENGKLEEGPD